MVIPSATRELAPWDVFLSHAREDKETVARPLASLLSRAGLRVWLDDTELVIGDSLRRKIDQGLAHSRHGVVILSQSFFSKHWPQEELSALTALESRGRSRILPVWHGIDHETIANASPLLADKLAAKTEHGLEMVALQILKAIKPNNLSEEEWRDFIRHRGMIYSSPEADFFERPESLLGRTIGGYTLAQLLGAGGSGFVFKVLGASTGRVAALKLFYPLPQHLDHFLNIYERGFEGVRRLGHPGIASIFEVNRTEINSFTTAYVAMEYIEGQALGLWSEGLVGDVFAQRLAVAKKLCAALKAAHEATYFDSQGLQVRGILHGDIKPANILVTVAAEPKLVDFLLVDVHRILDPRIVPRHLFDRDMPCTAALGTPGFMAPEQESEGLLTVQSDIFSLGRTMFYLFCPKAAKEACYFGYLDQEFLDLPPALRRLIESMTSSETKNRPRSVRQVLKTLEGLPDEDPRFY